MTNHPDGRIVDDDEYDPNTPYYDFCAKRERWRFFSILAASLFGFLAIIAISLAAFGIATVNTLDIEVSMGDNTFSRLMEFTNSDRTGGGTPAEEREVIIEDGIVKWTDGERVIFRYNCDGVESTLPCVERAEINEHQPLHDRRMPW